MVKRKIALVIASVTVLSIILVGCNNEDSTKKSNEVSPSISNASENNNTEENKEVAISNNSDEAESSEEKNDSSNSVTKIKGRQEYLGKLDNIQKELDLLPEKKDSDAGITIAMKSYYGQSYEMYDKALNEIYDLLKENLSSDVMEALKSKQIEWISLKEEKATKEA